jgi:hypothetical protein
MREVLNRAFQEELAAYKASQGSKFMTVDVNNILRTQKGQEEEKETNKVFYLCVSFTQQETHSEIT